MRAFYTPSGSVVAGFSDQDIVDQMAEEKFTTAKSRQSYMRAVARRINGVIADDGAVDPTTSKRFVRTMVEVGQLTPV
jgi:hypothetical protein